ncbi:MAG: hypothetical protein KDE55_06350 [Novosphingobium sp.]|nr:hypothetical protein [Novosphingobium sp.]
MIDRIRQAQANGLPSFGSWISIADGNSAEIMAQAGFDWLILDMQHGGIDAHSCAGILRAVELSGIQALVRVPGNDQAQIMRALDLGAAGVIVPMVCDANQARHAAEAVRYPPAGIRSFGKVRSYYSEDRAPLDPLCFVMVETADAIANLDEIAATPGVDGLFVGPVDLSLSLGLGLSMNLEDPVLEAIDQTVAACGKYGKIAGCPAFSPESAQVLVRHGVTFVTIGADIGFVRRGAAEMAALAGNLRESFLGNT